MVTELLFVIFHRRTDSVTVAKVGEGGTGEGALMQTHLSLVSIAPSDFQDEAATSFQNHGTSLSPAPLCLLSDTYCHFFPRYPTELSVPNSTQQLGCYPNISHHQLELTYIGFH